VTVTELGQIWHTLMDRDRPPLHEEKVTRYTEAGNALELLKSAHPELYKGERDAELNLEQAKKLNESLKHKATLKAYRFRVNFINKGLRQGARDLGWTVVLLPRTVSLKRDTPPFTEKTFSALKQVRQLEEAFVRDLATPLHGETAASRLFGQLLLSAILYGGLLHRKWIDAWLRAVPDGVRSNGSCLWIEMTRQHEMSVMTSAGKKNEKIKITLHRRWFADPLTEALLYRYFKRTGFQVRRGEGEDFPGSALPPRSWGYLRGYLIHLGFAKTDFVKSQVKFLQNVKIRTDLQLSPALAGYATGDLPSVSLSPAVWTRLLSGKTVPITRKVSELNKNCELLVPNSFPAEQSSTVHSMYHQEIILGELRSAIYQKKRDSKGESGYHQDSRKALIAVELVEDRRAGEMWPVLRCLVSWMKFMLASNRKKDAKGIRGRALASSTVGTYLSAFATVLLAEMEDKNPLEMSSEDLADIYEEAANGKKTIGERQKAIEAMARYHGYLVETMGLPLVTFSSTGGNAPVEATVRANIISPAMYRSVLDVLGFDRPEISRERQVSILLAILAFRCGLRDSEGRLLLMSDLQGTKKPELLIRPHLSFRTKTDDGIRRIPLHLLLDPQDELPRLLNWQRMRRTQEFAQPTDLLFALDKVPFSNNEVIEPVIAALRQVTGDQNIVFHDLRHSCATWLLFRLMCPNNEEALGNFAFIAEPHFSFSQMQALRRSLLDSEEASRQVLYLLALVIGHSSPDVTVQTYLHLFDWLLWAEFSDQKKAVKLNAEAVQAITQLSRSNIWSTHKKTGLDHWTINPYLRPMRRRWARVLQEPLVASATDIDCRPLPDENVREGSGLYQNRVPDWRIIQRIITTCQHYPHRHLEQADSYGISVDAVSRWLERANSIGRYKTRSGEYRHLSRYADDVQKILDHFPMPPREERDIAMVDRIFSRFSSAGDENLPSMVAGLEYFLNHYSVSRGGIRVVRSCQARRYLEFLEIVGVPRDYVRLQLYAPADADENDCERMIVDWGRKLNICRAHCEVPDKFYDGQSGSGSIVIKVVGSRDRYVKKKYFKKKPIYKTKGINKFYLPNVSYGFRYALYLMGLLLDDCRVEYGKTSDMRSIRMKDFRHYLRDVFISKKTGKKLGEKVILDAVSRCKRIENSLAIDLDAAINGQAVSLHNLLEMIEAHSNKFAFDGNLRKGVLNLKNAASLYNDFIAWEQTA